MIIGKKKSMAFRKTYFHLCAGSQDEFWVRLKRSNQKKGVTFRPLRKVVHVDVMKVTLPATATATAAIEAHGESEQQQSMKEQDSSYLNEGEFALQQSVVKD